MLGTFLQTTTPDQFMGRVMGLVMASAMVAQPAGLLLGGALIAWTGFTGFTLVIGSLVILVATALTISPALRRLDAVEPADPVAPAPGVTGKG